MYNASLPDSGDDAIFPIKNQFSHLTLIRYLQSVWEEHCDLFQSVLSRNVCLMILRYLYEPYAIGKLRNPMGHSLSNSVTFLYPKLCETMCGFMAFDVYERTSGMLLYKYQ